MTAKDFYEMNYKYAIFDLDGTCLDSMWLWEEVDREFLGKRGFEVPKDYLDAISTIGFHAAAVYTIERFGFNETPQELMDEWTRQAIVKYEKDVRLKPGVKEYLIRLKEKGVKMVVATASFREMFVPALKNNKIYDLFDGFVTVDDVGKSKSSPDIYLEAASIMGAKPEETVVFEDVYQGINTASRAGFFTVGIKEETSSQFEEIIKEKSNVFIESFEEI